MFTDNPRMREKIAPSIDLTAREVETIIEALGYIKTHAEQEPEAFEWTGFHKDLHDKLSEAMQAHLAT